MDKFKKFLTVFKKYQFWVICPIVAIVSLACWWKATGDVTARFNSEKQKIAGAFSSAQVGADHPNQDSITAVQKKRDILEQGVEKAWKYQYDQQKAKNKLPSVLGKEFASDFEALKPSPDAQLSMDDRTRYWSQIEKHIPTLKTIVDVWRPVGDGKEKDAAGAGARPQAGAAAPATTSGRGRLPPVSMPGGGKLPPINMPGGGLPPVRMPGGGLPPVNMPGMGAGGGTRGTVRAPTGPVEPDVEMTGIVDWPEDDFARIATRFKWDDMPSTFDILIAQEDLWVYEALLGIIKQVNEGATSHATAPVKRIEALEIGSEARKSWDQADVNILKLSSSDVGGGGAPMSGMPPTTANPLGGTASATAIPPMPSPTGPSQASEVTGKVQQLMEGRYVDEKGAPLPYDSEYPHVKHPVKQYKIMPIRLRWIVDQRKLPNLLVALANASMPIEVKRVLIMKEGGGDASGSAGAASTLTAGLGPFDLPVEIHATMYIFNPPEGESTGAAAAPAETPAGNPSTPTP